MQSPVSTQGFALRALPEFPQINPVAFTPFVPDLSLVPRLQGMNLQNQAAQKQLAEMDFSRARTERSDALAELDFAARQEDRKIGRALQKFTIDSQKQMAEEARLAKAQEAELNREARKQLQAQEEQAKREREIQIIRDERTGQISRVNKATGKVDILQEGLSDVELARRNTEKLLSQKAVTVGIDPLGYGDPVTGFLDTQRLSTDIRNAMANRRMAEWSAQTNLPIEQIRKMVETEEGRKTFSERLNAFRAPIREDDAMLFPWLTQPQGGAQEKPVDTTPPVVGTERREPETPAAASKERTYASEFEFNIAAAVGEVKEGDIVTVGGKRFRVKK